MEQMVIKSLYETIFSDKIEEVNFYASAFELKTSETSILAKELFLSKIIDLLTAQR